MTAAAVPPPAGSVDPDIPWHYGDPLREQHRSRTENDPEELPLEEVGRIAVAIGGHDGARAVDHHEPECDERQRRALVVRTADVAAGLGDLDLLCHGLFL